MNIIQNAIPLILTPMMGMIVWMLKKSFNDRCTASNGIKLLLKSQLRQLHKEHMEAGKISADDVVEFNEIYDAYHELKGNGLGTLWKEDIDKLERIG